MSYPNATPLRKITVNQDTWNTMHDIRVGFSRMSHEITTVRAEVAEIKNTLAQTMDDKLDNILRLLSEVLPLPNTHQNESRKNNHTNYDGLLDNAEPYSMPSCPSPSSFLRRRSTGFRSASRDANGDAQDHFENTNGVKRSNEPELFAENSLDGKSETKVDAKELKPKETTSKEPRPEELRPEETKSKEPRPKRLLNGDFELDMTNETPSPSLTEQEKRLLADWPHIVLPSQLPRYGLTSDKSEFYFKTFLELRHMDNTVLSTLCQLQSQFIASMVPYRLWPIHLVFIMSEDFQQIADWASASDLTWLDMVEVVFQNLKKRHVWRNPVSCFENIVLEGRTDVEIFAQIRRVYYNLPKANRKSIIVREGLINKMQIYIPWAFLLLGPRLNDMSTGTVIEEILRLLRMSNEYKLRFNVL